MIWKVIKNTPLLSVGRNKSKIRKDSAKMYLNYCLFFLDNGGGNFTLINLIFATNKNCLINCNSFNFLDCYHLWLSIWSWIINEENSVRFVFYLCLIKYYSYICGVLVLFYGFNSISGKVLLIHYRLFWFNNWKPTFHLQEIENCLIK